MNLRLRDHPRAAGLGHFAGVGGLVVVGRARQRHQDRRPAGRGQLGDGRGAGAGDDEMRPGEPLGQVGQIGGEIGRDAERGIARAHLLDILGPALLGDLQPAAEMLGQQRQPLGHDLGEDRGALAAAGDEQRGRCRPRSSGGKGWSRSASTSSRTGLPTRWTLSAALAGSRWTLGIGGGDRVDPAGHQPVDPAEHRILLVDQGRDAVAPRREQGREGRIAAEADHRRGQEGLVEPQRHRPPGHDRLRTALSQPTGPPASRPAGRIWTWTLSNRPGMRAPRSSVISATRCPRRSNSSASAWAGHHMAAGAARGEDIVARHHSEPAPSARHRAGRADAGCGGVKASSRPKPIASAIIDEPP